MVENLYLYLWGKKDNRGEKWHALLWHLIDSGNVAQLIWTNHLSNSFKQQICDIFSLNEPDTKNLVAFWISLHDIGKAGPAFQRKFPEQLQIFIDNGVQLPNIPTQTKGYHSLATTWIVRDYLKSKYPQNLQFVNHIAITLGGHHGDFPLNEEILESAYQRDHLGGSAWQEMRSRLIRDLELIFNPPNITSPPTERNTLNAVSMLIAGLTTTSDWIASNENYFPYFGAAVDQKEYVKKSFNYAHQALLSLGWERWEPDNQRLDFSRLFPNKQPHPLQKAFFERAANISSPYLVILEAPTGIGKTEAALWLTDRTLQKEKGGGFYIAMPTQATSNQMFKRAEEFLRQRYPQEAIKVRLVHGAALLNDLYDEFNLTGIDQDNQDSYASLTSQDWFLPRKRTLLASFGIGTVDQTFMAVLRARHFFMRLFGLSHKVVIFDEVHAYDVFMLEIFKRLISWLRTVNASVIILTATLPRTSREEMVEAFFLEPKPLPDAPFPRITICSSGSAEVIPLPKTDNRTIAMEWLNDHDIENAIQEKLMDGGNAAIICNRVKRVQALYDRMITIFPEDEVEIFHSRYPLCWRAEIESRITGRYGKDSQTRPHRSIVIATQVIEQSLDLDFDFLISDVAPVDLIIQRLGRLHRHLVPGRPRQLTKPAIALIHPVIDEQGLPVFGDDTFVYKRYVLERTYFCLQQYTALTLPEQSDELIGCVYSQEYHSCIPENLWQVMLSHFDEMLEKNTRDELKALNQLIHTPDRQVLGRITSTFNDEHDPKSHNIVNAVTRNTRPSVQLVCLLKKKEGLYPLDSNPAAINLDEKPDQAAVKSCLLSSLSISDPSIVNFFLNQARPHGWLKNAHLRTHYAAVFEQNICPCGENRLVLDPLRGVLIE